MIVLDTHIWVWWVHSPQVLSGKQRDLIKAHEKELIGVSAISCWEVAKLVEYQRLDLPFPVMEWIEQALIYPGIQLLPLSPSIAVESTQLPQPFHKDPADQIIVATARIHNCPLLTVDEKIIDYSHVNTQ